MTKMTVGQAIVKFLDNQYIELDGEVTKFVDGVFTIFGHGIVVGLGQALDENRFDDFRREYSEKLARRI